MTCFRGSRVVLSPFVLALVTSAGCSVTGIGSIEPTPDAGTDVGVVERDAPTTDAWRAPDAPDAPLVDDGCFDDVTLVRLNGGREGVSVNALAAHEQGWLVLYSAFSHGGPGGQFVAFVDREGTLRATSPAPAEDGYSGHAMIGEHLVSWDTYGGPMRVRRLAGNALIDVDDVLEEGHVGRITHVDVSEDGSLRIVSYTASPDFTVVTYRLAELVLGADGRFTARSSILPPTTEIGAASLDAHVIRFGGMPTPLYGDGEVRFVFQSGDDPFSLDGEPWHEVHARLDGELGVAESLTWTVERELRWEGGPRGVSSVLVDHGIAITGRWLVAEDGSRPATILAETLPSAPSAPARVLAYPPNPSRLGPATVIRRGERLGLSTGDQFQVLSLPDLAVVARTPLVGSSNDIENAVVWSGDDRVLEVVSSDEGEGYVATLRCHALH